MSGAVDKTIQILEQEIAAIEQRRDELRRAVESLRPLTDAPSRRRSKQALKRNERTNERTSEQSAGQRDGASLTARPRKPRDTRRRS